MTGQQTTRIHVDADRHITVDWSVVEYRFHEATWLVSGRCRLWQSRRLFSNPDVSVGQLMGVAVDITTEGMTVQRALNALMHAAWVQCLEGKGDDDIEH